MSTKKPIDKQKPFSPPSEPACSGSHPPHRRRRVRWAVAVAVAVAALAWHDARSRATAHPGAHGVATESQLPGLGELAGPSSSVVVNGQRLRISTHVLEESLEAVVSRARALCRAGDRAFGSEDAGSDSGSGPDPAAAALARALTIDRRSQDGSATVMCLAGVAGGGLAALVRRVAAFARTLDVGHLGRLRVAHLRPVSGGTHVVLVRSEGSLRLRELLLPSGRDTIGERIVPRARPPRSDRFLTVRWEQAPHNFDAYRSQLSASHVFAGYRRRLQAAGYHPVVTSLEPEVGSDPGAGPAPPNAAARAGLDRRPRRVFAGVFRHKHHTVIATSIAASDQRQGSLLSVMELGTSPIAPPFGAP